MPGFVKALHLILSVNTIRKPWLLIRCSKGEQLDIPGHRLALRQPVAYRSLGQFISSHNLSMPTGQRLMRSSWLSNGPRRRMRLYWRCY